MSFRVIVGRRPLPVGLPTLQQVQALTAQAEAAAQTAAADAVASAQAQIAGDVTAAEAARDATVGYETRAEAAAANIPAPVQKITVMHDGEALEYLRKPATMSSSNVPLTTAGAQHWVPAGDATLRHWGAVGDCDPVAFTGTDNRPMATALFAWAGANDVRKVVINRGNFLIVKPGPGLPTIRYASLNLEVVGHGMWASNLFFKDRGVSSTRQPFLSKLRAAIKESATFRDFSITADWGWQGDWGEGSHGISVSGGGGICHFQRVRFRRIGSMCITCSDSERVSVTDCVFDNSQRDGIHATGCKNVYVAGNFFKGVCDDAVAVATVETSSQYSDSVIIEGNIFEDSQGMNLASVQTLIVRNNILKRPTIRGIQAGRASGTWAAGSIARFNLIIEGNIVTDVMKRDRFGGSGADYAYISVVDVTSDATTDASGLPTLAPTPTGYTFNPDGAGGIVSPAPWLHARENFVGNLNIQVKDNVCMRTLEPVASYLDYGFGPRPVHNVGPYSGDVIEDDFYDKHYQLKGVIRNALVEGNISYGAGTPIYMADYLDGAAVEADNVVLRGNILTNIKGAAAIDYSGGYVVFAEGNLIDGDPLHRHASRGANGTWVNGTGLVGYRASRGKIVVKGGTVRNLAGVMTEVAGGKVTFLGPLTIMADLHGRGDAAANRGIRSVPANIVVDYMRVGADPDAADYGRITSVSERCSDAMPTTGYYLAGHVVTNASPAVVAGQIVTGWLRLTTGSTHLADTDWHEIRSTAS